VSVHSHELAGKGKEDVPAFLQELAHRCIDMGANAIIGHGPHLLRPVEVYKDSPIFYSLGDFILQLYNIELAPEDFFAKCGMTSRETVHALLKKRSHDFTIGLMADKKMNESVIPYWEMENGKLTKLELMPIKIAMEGHKSDIGLPRADENPEFFDRFAKMSEPYGVKMSLENGIIKCEW
jgi:poly-gamma-glutamate synthesis protein (capsule biosynthesis protein)